MVWNPARNAPVAKHPTRKAATLEAERLARQQRGEKFYVLKTVSESAVPVETITKPVTFQKFQPDPDDYA